MPRCFPLTVVLCLVLLQVPGQVPAAEKAGSRPNILWLTCEDISPNLGCYGDPFAVTPNLDQLAAQGVRYSGAFSVAGVCAPSRSCLITGMYPSSLGSQHMRSSVRLPESVKCFTEYLRHAGYYCSNNSKQDYNFSTPKTAWDESSNKAHWRKRKGSQPFFSVFNHTGTHESKLWSHDSGPKLPAGQRHDPAKANLPPYLPDTPLGRGDWTEYGDVITLMDKWVGKMLQELDRDGLAEDTIVFFYSDHGVGLPRSKFWLYDSGIHVPLIIRFPEKYRHLAPVAAGSACDRLVSFVDFGPTVLSLAGVPIPAHMQGKPFLGAQAAQPREYIFAARGRMGTQSDLMRAVRDHRYKYLRNFVTYRPFAFRGWWIDRQNSSRELWRLAAEGQLPEAAELFMRRSSRPAEELYDLQNDPHELHNLAASPEHQAALQRLRQVQLEQMRSIRDLGLMPEREMHTRVPNLAPYDMARQGDEIFPFERILEVANLSAQRPQVLSQLLSLTSADDPAIRYWAVIGLANLQDSSPPTLTVLRKALDDPSIDVQLAAADALCQLGHEADTLPTLARALKHKDGWVQTRALGLIDELDEKARPILDDIKSARGGGYVKRMIPNVLKGIAPKEGKTKRVK